MAIHVCLGPFCKTINETRVHYLDLEFHILIYFYNILLIVATILISICSGNVCGGTQLRYMVECGAPLDPPNFGIRCEF